jgi:3',5'-cyclic AMP phosphodiesterase CpdA
VDRVAAATAEDALGPVRARLDRPRLADPVALAVVADAHLAVDHAGTWKVLHRTEQRLRTALVAARGPSGPAPNTDAILFAGDQTHDGLRREFDRLDAFLGGLDRPWTAIPGNHDVPKRFDDHEGLPLHAVRERYRGDATPWVGETDARNEQNAFPWTLDIGGLRVVCLNTAAPPGESYVHTWGGAVGAEQRERLRATLAEAPDAPTILLAHHNLGSLPEHEPAAPWDRFPVDDAAAVRALLTEADVPLAITGHHHVPAVRRHGGLTELMAPAVCSFPQAMVRLHVGPEGTTVRLVPLAPPSGVEEAYWHAATGKALGRGVLDMATTRVGPS